MVKLHCFYFKKAGEVNQSYTSLELSLKQEQKRGRMDIEKRLLELYD